MKGNNKRDWLIEHTHLKCPFHPMPSTTFCYCSETPVKIGSQHSVLLFRNQPQCMAHFVMIGLELQLYSKLSVFGGSFGGKVAIVLNVCSKVHFLQGYTEQSDYYYYYDIVLPCSCFILGNTLCCELSWVSPSKNSELRLFFFSVFVCCHWRCPMAPSPKDK